MRVTFTMDIDLLEYNRYFKTKELDGDLMAIYDMICTQSNRLNEQGEPENIRAFFDIDPETLNLVEDEVRKSIKFKTSFHPHLKRIK